MWRIMFFFRCTACVLALFLVLSTPAVSQSFFQAIDDLPLAPGLLEAVDDGVRFDSPGGRIVTVVAYGEGPIDVYREFYARALPALGWEFQGPGRYLRDGENLSFDFNREGQRVSVKIRLVPLHSEKTR